MIVKTYCARMDHGGCGILAHVENGKITKIEGDPDSPLSRGALTRAGTDPGGCQPGCGAKTRS